MLRKPLEGVKIKHIKIQALKTRFVGFLQFFLADILRNANLLTYLFNSKYWVKRNKSIL